MRCQEVRDLLSPYYDDELSPDIRAQATTHVESCSQCARELASFQSLSQSASELDHPEPPAIVWERVEAQLEAESNPLATKQAITKSRSVVLTWASIAALCLVAVSLGLFGYHKWHDEDHHELAGDFTEYLDAFQQNPDDAHFVLVNKYAGKAVDLDVAHDRLGYRPALAEGLPEGYTVQTAYVMDMPCCKCIKCLCKRSDGSTVAIFEHDDEQPIWFEDRPSIQTQCGGKACTVIQLDGHIAVSWEQSGRHLTIVGATNVEEAAELITYLTET